MQERLSRVRVDELDVASRRMVDSALRLQSGQALVVIGDASSSRIGDAISRAASAAGGRVRMIWLDEIGPRPMSALPEEVVSALTRCDASVYVASAPHEELLMRQHLLHTVGVERIRHAHMPGISAFEFARGMRVDYDEVARDGRRVLARLERGSTVAVSSPAGTLLRVYFDPDTRWYAQLGELLPGRWGNLPAGALYATPSGVHGTFVANASLGEFFGRREGSLMRAPVVFDVTDGRIARVRAPTPALQRDLEAVLAVGPNSDRIGLVAVGVSDSLRDPSGEALVDQNLPGLHLCIGDPAARVTGATWTAPTSFAACQCASTVGVDGETIVREGRLVRPD